MLKPSPDFFGGGCNLGASTTRIGFWAPKNNVGASLRLYIAPNPRCEKTATEPSYQGSRLGAAIWSCPGRRKLRKIQGLGVSGLGLSSPINRGNRLSEGLLGMSHRTRRHL